MNLKHDNQIINTETVFFNENALILAEYHWAEPEKVNKNNAKVKATKIRLVSKQTERK